MSNIRYSRECPGHDLVGARDIQLATDEGALMPDGRVVRALMLARTADAAVTSRA